MNKLTDEIKKGLDVIREHLRNKEISQAITKSNELVLDNPKVPQILNMRGVVLMNKGDYLNALKDFDKALGLDSNTGYIITNKVFALMKLNKLTEAKKIVKQALTQSPNDVALYDTYARIYLTEGKYTEAIEQINKALKIVPGSPQLTKRLNDISETVKYRALKDSTYDSIYDEAFKRYKNKEKHVALGIINILLKVKEDAKYYELQGRIMAEVENPEKSINSFEKSLELGGTENTTQFLAKTLTSLGGDNNLNEAINNYKLAIKLHPERGNLYYERAGIYSRIREYKKAMSDIDKSISIEKANPFPYVRKGDIYTHLLEFNKAIEMYDKALELSPTLKEAFTKKQQVEIAKTYELGISNKKDKGMFR